MLWSTPGLFATDAATSFLREIPQCFLSGVRPRDLAVRIIQRELLHKQ